ncbi:MAG: hypothetical protein PW734_11155 [Verrucomicrobium sp.]|nr:hypothetical protein [Verrucomicrobium sp.]
MIWKRTLSALAALALAACGKPAGLQETATTEDKAPAAEEGAAYEEEKGLSLSEASRQSLGVAFATAELRPVRAETTVTAQVYRAASEPLRHFGKEKPGNAYATVWVDPASVPAKAGQRIRVGLAEAEGEAGGTIWRIANASLAATGKEELLLEIPDPAGRLAVGDFLPVRIEPGEASKPVVTVPRSAVLHAAAGTSAYLERDGRLLRVPVVVGNEADGWIEIKDGLAEGDKVASAGVDSLYLIELRFTKGGGHAD